MVTTVALIAVCCLSIQHVVAGDDATIVRHVPHISTQHVKVSAEWSADYQDYTVYVDGVASLKGSPVAIYAENQWFSSQTAADATGSLTKEKTSTATGHDALGDFSAHSVEWKASSSGNGAPTFEGIVTTLKNYNDIVVFEYRLPSGASGFQKNRSEVITNFPSFTWNPFEDVLSWHGSFSQAADDFTLGPTGGPTVLYNGTTLGTALLGSPLDHFKGAGETDHTYSGTPAWVPGIAATFDSLPSNFSHSFLLTSSKGITQTIYDYSNLLKAMYNVNKVKDITVDTLGYQTDNGAQYCFCRSDCDQTLLNMSDYLTSIDVKLGYMSFQGGWWNLGDQSAPWCVKDFQTNGKYPMSVPDFQKELAIPLQLYAPYFCNDSDYAQNWTFVASDVSIEGCGGFSFLDISPEESYKFYSWFFDLGQSYGMVSFEPDFMNQNFNCVPEFISNIDASATWMRGMHQAAADRDLAIQWCYATPTDLLQALEFDTVTNFRSSFDYYYGGSYRIGESSLIVWAAGGRPSKDTFWTTDNGDLGPKLGGCGSKGCPADHSNSSCALHTILTVLSTGPVGFSDAIGMTNASLIKQTCMSNGTLLQPSKPITTIDVGIASNNPRTPPGSVYGTHTIANENLVVNVYYVLSFQLTHSWELKRSDLWPQPAEDIPLALRWWGNVPCKNGDDAESCISFSSSQTVAPLPIADAAEPLTPRLLNIYPMCPISKWGLLGELSKITAISVERFSKVECTSTGVDFAVHGAPGESVTVTLVRPAEASPSYTIYTKTYTFTETKMTIEESVGH